MAGVIRELQMGNYAVTLKEIAEGQLQAKLTSMTNGNLLEIEKGEGNNIRLRELDFGSAELTLEHLAVMLHLIGADADIISELEKINRMKNND
jgi:hypothetical protein